MATKLIIFDLDGTLLYTLEDLKNSVNFALQSCNIEPITIEKVRQYVGNGIYKLIERATKNNRDKFEKCLAVFKKNYENSYKNTYPYGNIIETLKKLKKMNIKLAVLSNKADYMVKRLVEFYFNSLIDFSMGESKNFPIKPNPISCEFIINKFKVKKEETLFIGDSEVDIQTAKNVQIRSISVSWGYKNKDFLIKSGAKIIINNPEEILDNL